MQVVVIGNGIAGTTAALVITRQGSNVVTVLSKADEPTFSACILPNYIAGEISRERVYLRSDYQAGPNIEIRLGQQVRGIDIKDHAVRLKRGSLEYDRLVIATGSRPTMPPIDGLKKKGVFSLKTIADADRIIAWPAKKAVVVGAGPLAVEAAVALRKRGCRVAMVVRSRIMRRLLDERAALVVSRILDQHGIDIFFGEEITGITGKELVRGVLTTSRELLADMVVLGVGMTPDVALAVEAGLAVGKLGGITVDEHMMTSAEGIYACGDCVQTLNPFTGQPMLNLTWPSARHQSMVAGYNCAGGSRTYHPWPPVTNMPVFGVNVVSIGSTAESLATKEVRIQETEHDGRYHRLVTVNDEICGFQSIAPADGAGTLLRTMTARTALHGRLPDALIAQLSRYSRC